MLEEAVRSRIHLYSKIHKAQRAWLMRLMVEAGQIDTDDADAVRVAMSDTRRLVQHLRDHAEHEERFIHPVLREAAADIADRLDGEHVRLDASLEQLERTADAGLITDLYRAISGFVSLYFPHLDVEELAAMPAIWAHVDDGTMLERIMRPFLTSRSSIDMIDDLRLQMHALNSHEQRDLLSAVIGK